MAGDFGNAARAAGLTTVVCAKGLTHTRDPRYLPEDESDCGKAVRPGETNQVCMWCREQPGRRTHEREVLGT